MLRVVHVIVHSLLSRIVPYAERTNSPTPLLRHLDFAGAFNAQSNLVAQLEAALADFQKEKAARIEELRKTVTPLDAEHADVRPEDLELLDLAEAEEELANSLTENEKILQSLSKLALADSSPRKRELVTVQSFDAERGTATLTDGRLLFLPRTPQEEEPASDELLGVFGAGSQINIEASAIDGALIGHQVLSTVGGSAITLTEVVPSCARLAVVPADRRLPNFDTGVRHDLRAYTWPLGAGAQALYLEHGMAFAMQVGFNCIDSPHSYKHWLGLSIDRSLEGHFSTLVHELNATSAPFVLRAADLPSNRLIRLRVREFRARIFEDGLLGPHQLLTEETFLMELHEYGYYARAYYDRSIFEIEDIPGNTQFQLARVNSIGRFHPLTTKPVNEMTFQAHSFKPVGGNQSSFPALLPIGFNDPFAVHDLDPNVLFGHPNDVGSGISDPTISGFNNGYQFTYRVTPPPIVRDRLHECEDLNVGELPDSYYRIPFLGPDENGIRSWEVSQGNGGSFTHKGKGRFAFDFPKPHGLQILAARGGIVTRAKESSSMSCWDSNAEACVDCEEERSPNVVSIRHQDGTRGTYVHFQKNGVIVTKGQRVRRGDPIGYVGTTGCSTGPHLHFEVFDPTIVVNSTIPIRFEAYDDDSDFHECYLPGHSSDGFSTNKPWWWPY